MHKLVRTIAVLATALLLSNCATIVQGNRQRVSVASIPPGAQVIAAGESRGVTPTTVLISRWGGETVWIEAPGEQRYAVTFTRKHSGLGWWLATFGNWWNGGLGFFVDIFTGAVFELTPDFVSAPLAVSATAPTAAAFPSAGPQALAPGLRRTVWVSTRGGESFYWHECDAVRRIHRDDRIYFESYEEARATGRTVSREPGCEGPGR
jgi:hypothetical protein